MKQIEGQETIFGYIKKRDSEHTFKACSQCVCNNCLYEATSRCPYGKCYDDRRAKEDPYDKVHPDKPPRTCWSNWRTDQAYWCRGGVFYPVFYCEQFVKYTGSEMQECIACNIWIFQDGYISCSLKDSIGCEACIARQEGKKRESAYDCQYMTDTGCERMVTAKNLMLQEIIENKYPDIEMCREQCCKGCTKVCGYRCGQC